MARDLGINPGTLANWVAKDKVARGERLDPNKVDPDKLRQLEAENAELPMERDVLKRSGVLWVKVASFIASQRADFKVPHVISCRALSVKVAQSMTEDGDVPGSFEAVPCLEGGGRAQRSGLVGIAGVGDSS